MYFMSSLQYPRSLRVGSWLIGIAAAGIASAAIAAQIPVLNPGFDDVSGITGQNNGGDWTLNNTFNFGNGSYNGWTVTAGGSGTGVINVDPGDMSVPMEATSGDIALILSQNVFRVVQQTTEHVISSDDLAFQLSVDVGSGKVGAYHYEIMLYADDGFSKFYIGFDEVNGENATPGTWSRRTVTASQDAFAPYIGSSLGIELRHHASTPTTPSIEVFMDSVTLTVTDSSSAISGDYNLDGAVDGADFLVWQRNVGGPAGSLPNDNGIADPIGAPHLELWKANYGAPAGIATSLTAVPEPASATSLLVGICIATRMRGRTSPRIRSGE